MALVAANLLGILGVVIAAPSWLLCSLFGQYICGRCLTRIPGLRKNLDQHPAYSTYVHAFARDFSTRFSEKHNTLATARKQTSHPDTDPPDLQEENLSQGEKS